MRHHILFFFWSCEVVVIMVVGFMTTYVISTYHHYRCEFEFRPGEEYLIQQSLSVTCGRSVGF